MRTPRLLGLPDKFVDWRRGQLAAVREILFAKDRVVALVSPTGSGKSATYMSYAGAFEDERVAVVTATKALQSQLESEFSVMGMVDVRGRDNYLCDVRDRDSEPGLTAAHAICVFGKFCPNMKEGPCGYYDQRRKAERARIVLTNYAFWMEHPDLGHFDCVIFDEANKAADAISSFGAVEIHDTVLRRLSLAPPPMYGLKPGLEWAVGTLTQIQRRELTRPGMASDETVLLAKKLQLKLARLCRFGTQAWIRSKGRKTWRWDLIDPSALAEDVLFRKAKKIVLSSASLRRKTLRLLGLDGTRGKGVTVVEQESTFPIARRPIYYWPVVRVNRKISREKQDRLHEAIAEIVNARPDRKGLIHSVSFDLGIEIWQRADDHGWQGRTLIHKRGVPAEEVIEEFRQSERTTVLISPSVMDGVNFEFQDCEFQILPKVPFPGMMDPLVRARNEHDPSYSTYIAFQGLVQASGRPMRAAEDQAETFLLDGSWDWMRSRYPDFAPQWFLKAIKKVSKDGPPPDPPLSLHDQDPVRHNR